ncbi:isoprenylcysteine carboxylmethyltransferase family protein [Candidatus Bathyarchaeota archaeon]|nr:isoprenylcysteine carboxylmethyltransferase family protein [Candidatus Bathyarchaeota archaeon]
MSKNKKFLGDEYPKSDEIQVVMLIFFLLIWGLDSFWLNFSTVQLLIPSYILIFFGFMMFIVSAYMMNESHKLVIDPEQHSFVDYSVFSWVRHPMYLGSVLIYFSFSLVTLSIVSLVLSVIYFIIYDRFADYEEKELIKLLNGVYLEYMKKVHRWIPFLK